MPRVSEDYRAKRLDQLYRATWLGIAEVGLERMTITDIIERSGFSAGMVYNYFASKDELVEAAQLEAIRRARAAVDAGTKRPTSGPAQLFDRVVTAIATRPDAGDNAMLALWTMNASSSSTERARADLAEFQAFALERFQRHVVAWRSARGLATGKGVVRGESELLISIMLGFFAQQRFLTLGTSQPLLAALRAVRGHKAALRRLWPDAR